MSAKTFEIKPYGKTNAVFHLSVCETRKGMIAAIKKHIKKSGNDSSYPCGNTQGMFIPTVQIVRRDVRGTLSSNCVGTVFLNLEDIDTEILAHECAHAAFAYEYNFRRYTGNFDDDGFDEQESYCYFLGLAVRKAREAIRKNFKGVRL